MGTCVIASVAACLTGSATLDWTERTAEAVHVGKYVPAGVTACLTGGATLDWTAEAKCTDRYGNQSARSLRKTNMAVATLICRRHDSCLQHVD